MKERRWWSISGLASIGHGSKKIIYKVYGNYVDGPDKDAGLIEEYFGSDLGKIWLNDLIAFTNRLVKAWRKSEALKSAVAEIIAKKLVASIKLMI